jgi:hypothetical protein
MATLDRDECPTPEVLFTILFEFFLNNGDVVSIKYPNVPCTHLTVDELFDEAMEEFTILSCELNADPQEPVYRVSLYPSEFEELVGPYDPVDHEHEAEIESVPLVDVNTLERLYKMGDDVHGHPDDDVVDYLQGKEYLGG